MPKPILIVEDDLLQRELLRCVLELDGYAVLEAADAEEGLAIARRDDPAVILMDWKLPGLDGLSATMRLKSDPATRRLPVIAVTAYALRGDPQRAYAAGCCAYMAKPIDSVRLLELVRIHGRGPAANE